MASKQKRKPARPADIKGVPLRQGVDRLIAQERYKEAVKQAKICHKEEPTSEHHSLLERAYFLRATQLLQSGMSNGAQEVAHHLMEFGITDPTLNEPVAALLLKVGLAGQAFKLQGHLESPEARERLTRAAADAAVTGSGLPATLPAELREGADKIRRALEAVQAGDEPKAMAELQEISRNSPFADWRLFVRGWASFRRREDAEARANWDRLDPARDAAKIAGSMLVLAGSERGDAASAAKLDKLERRMCGTSVLKPLYELNSQLTQGNWPEVFTLVRTLRYALTTIDQRLAERLTQALCFPLTRDAIQLDFQSGKRMLTNFTRVAEPLPIDPNWNRLWAMVWEAASDDVVGAERYWRAYLEDLKTSPAIRPELRGLAQAMVLSRLANSYIEFADESKTLKGKKLDSVDLKVRKAITNCLEESLRLAPEYLRSYKQMIDVYTDWEVPAEAAAVAKRLLEVSPDDFEALQLVSVYHSCRNEVKESLEYASRARELRPLDPKAIRIEWYAHWNLARSYAMVRQFGQARSELEIAGRCSPENSSGVQFAALRAIIQLKAGETAASESIIREMIERLVEPAPLRLALLIESIRCKLPKPEQKRFETLWLDEVAKKPRGETAGRLASLMINILENNIKYTGRNTHLKVVAEYLKRTATMKYSSASDLSSVCHFLDSMKGQKKLYETLVKLGVKQFPKDPEFLLLLSTIELDKGPYGRKLWMIETRLKKALELVQAGEGCRFDQATLTREIRAILNVVEQEISAPFGFRGPGGMSPEILMRSFMSMMNENDSDMEEDSDD